MISSGAASFAQSFQYAPIILTNGIASGLTGGMPITDLLGPPPERLDDAFATFVPLSGGTILDQAVGTYPFANQSVAANAVIANPNVISMKMICPVRDPGGYANKLSIITGLQSSLQKHNNSGGTYTIATPSFYYSNCLLLLMRDISSAESKQAQIEWQIDFFQPLLTLAQAEAAQNTLTSKVSNATPVDGDPPAWSGVSTTAGSPPGVGTDGSSNTVAPPLRGSL